MRGRTAPAFAVFLVRRLFAGALLLVAVAATTFLLVSLAPGDTAQVLAGQSGADPAYLELLRERFGLNRPLPYQIASYLEALGRGDFGYSVVQGRPVLDVIAERLAASVVLAGTAILLAAFLGVWLGILAAVRRGRVADSAISVASLLAYSIPVFWLGQLLIGLFAVRLHWLPAGGMHDATDPGGLGDLVRHLAMPAFTLAVLLLALVVRVTRASMVDALEQEFVTAARARGLSERRVVVRHALRNALRPIFTVLTGYFSVALTGAVLVETVFTWPGLGRLLYDSVLARDTQTLTALLLLSAVIILLANLLADVVYRVLDPRARFE